MPGKPGEYDLEGGIWEDEDARNFYENMVDLKAFVPAILFKDNEKSGQAKEKEEAKGTESCYVHQGCERVNWTVRFDVTDNRKKPWGELALDSKSTIDWEWITLHVNIGGLVE